MEQLSHLALSLGKKGSRPMKMSSLNFLNGTKDDDDWRALQTMFITKKI
jgi:hypothetical protein